MLELKSYGHGFGNAAYHVVLVPKYRRDVFEETTVQEEAKRVFQEICKEYQYELSTIEIMPDHTHLFVLPRPTTSPSEMFHKLKGRSAYELFRRCPQIKKKLWGGHLWSRGKFFRSVGEVTAETVKRYIEESQGTKRRFQQPKPNAQKVSQTTITRFTA